MKRGLFASFQRLKTSVENKWSHTAAIPCNCWPRHSSSPHFSELGEPSAVFNWNQEIHRDPYMKPLIKWSRGISTAWSAAGYSPDQPEVHVGRVTQTESWILVFICMAELAEWGPGKSEKCHWMMPLCLSSRRLLQHVDTLRANWAALYPSSCLRISLRLLTQWADLMPLLPKIPYQWIIPLRSLSSHVG